MKVMHITLDSWHSQFDPEGWKQDPDGLGSDMLEDNLGGGDEEILGQINGTPIKESATEKGDTKTFREAQRWFYELQVL